VLVDDRFFIMPLIFFLIEKCHKITLYKMATMNTLNLCRPGHGASCALCCGSHNYNAPFEEIHALFKKRREIFKLYSSEYIAKCIRASRSNLTGSYYPFSTIDESIIITLPKLYQDGIQCPFVILLDDGTIGCAIYPETTQEDMRFDCFNNYTCKYFSCIAKEILTPAEIEYAARLFKDWYYYTLFIHSINILRQFKERYPHLENVSLEDINKLKQTLADQLPVDKNLHTIHSYFS